MKTPLLAAVLGGLVSIASAAFAADGFTFKDQPGEYLDMLHDGKIVGRYMYSHDVSTPDKRMLNYKPYLHVFDDEGHTPITKGAGGDFTHHRGIYIGWMKIGVNGKTYDRWHMVKGDQVHEKFLAQEADAKRASFTSLVRWTGDTPQDAIIEEERTHTFLLAPAPAYAVLDVTSKLKAVAGETKLGGDPEHAGLQFRPANEVVRQETVYFYPKEKADPHKDLDYPWFGETFSLNGKKYSVVFLNHPDNPKGAHISAYRDYGRFGIFPSPTIPKDGTQTVRARFLIVSGAMPSADVIQKAWNEYAGANEPAPKMSSKPAEFGKSPDSKKKGDAPAKPAPGAQVK
jgi:methane monooxygenase PmoA-like